MLSNGIMLLKSAYTLQGGVRFSEAIKRIMVNSVLNSHIHASYTCSSLKSMDIYILILLEK